MTRAIGKEIMTTVSFILSLHIAGQRPAGYLVRNNLEQYRNLSQLAINDFLNEQLLLPKKELYSFLRTVNTFP